MARFAFTPEVRWNSNEEICQKRVVSVFFFQKHPKSPMIIIIFPQFPACYHLFWCVHLFLPFLMIFWWFFHPTIFPYFPGNAPRSVRGPSEVLPRTKALSADSVASAVTAQAPSGRGAKTTATAVPVSFEYVPHIVHMFRHSFCWFCWFCWQLDVLLKFADHWTHWSVMNSLEVFWLRLSSDSTRLTGRSEPISPSPHLPIQGTEKTCKLRNGDAFTSSTQRCEALKVKVLRFLEVLRHNNTIAL